MDQSTFEQPLPVELVDVILDFYPVIFRRINRRFLARYQQQYLSCANSMPVSKWEYETYLTRVQPKYTGIYYFNETWNAMVSAILLEKKGDSWEVDYESSVNTHMFRHVKITHPRDISPTESENNRYKKILDPAIQLYTFISRGCDAKQCTSYIESILSAPGFPSAFIFMEKCFLGTKSDDPRGAIRKYLETL